MTKRKHDRIVFYVGHTVFFSGFIERPMYTMTSLVSFSKGQIVPSLKWTCEATGVYSNYEFVLGTGQRRFSGGKLLEIILRVNEGDNATT